MGTFVLDLTLAFLMACFHWRTKAAERIRRLRDYRVSTQTGKHGKMGRHFLVREFWTDWKSQGKSHKILEIQGISNIICYFLVIYKKYYLLKWIKFSVKKKTKHLKNTGKWKHARKVREFSLSGKVETMYSCHNFAITTSGNHGIGIDDFPQQRIQHYPDSRHWMAGNFCLQMEVLQGIKCCHLVLNRITKDPKQNVSIFTLNQLMNHSNRVLCISKAGKGGSNFLIIFS